MKHTFRKAAQQTFRSGGGAACTSPTAGSVMAVSRSLAAVAIATTTVTVAGAVAVATTTVAAAIRICVCR